MSEATLTPLKSVRPRGARTPWTTAFVILVALGLLVVVALALTVNALPSTPLHVSIDGEPVWSSMGLAQMPPAHKVVLAGVILLSLLAAMVVLPVALLLGALALAAIVLCVVALPLLIAALVLAVVLSPLWLLLWLVWRAVA
jgi:hypothetical protein